MIDFEWYRSFISIYQHRSVSGAAKARILTQPAMSQHLAALEAEVGEPLFTRAPRKMIPTEKGKELYTKLVPLIENLEKMTLSIRYASASASSAPLIRIGSPTEYFTKAALAKLSVMDIRMSVHFDVAPVLLDALQKDETDLILTTQKVQVAGIDYEKIEDEQFVLVAPDDYPEPEETEDWMKGQKWLSYGLELPIIRRFFRVHFGKRPEVQPHCVFPDLRTILEGIELGMGISVLPEYLIKDSLHAGKIKILFPERKVENTIFAAYKVENKDNPYLGEVLKVLKK
ncbi:LysR family transcriptional regulator [Metabacillus indicus]|uniref:LysR family transcriptional regulator n=1 Tax=Metabacillus indicus TaxID=246786 RepID=UPI002A00B0A4|nr:LysR family transcriptional regulator [Metabacillus indicus]MDX8291276.1 LysR family transcriptional regulator [Metabacillus indicus]